MVKKIMSSVAVTVAFVLLTGCDASRDEPIMPSDVEILVAVCRSNGGMRQAYRAALVSISPFDSYREWRIECANGAHFVSPFINGVPQ